MTERTLPQIGRLFDLSGRAALVTGGSRGLGKAMARALAEAGADIVIASRNESELTAAAAEIVQGLGGQVRHLVADLGNRDQVEASRARSGASSCGWRARPAATSRAPSWSSTAACSRGSERRSSLSPRGSAVLVVGARVVELLVVLAQQVPAIVIAVRRAHHRVDMGA